MTLALIILLLIIALGVFGAASVHFLLWVALVALVVWIALHFVGGATGGRGGYWGRY